MVRIRAKTELIDLSSANLKILITLGPGWPEGITPPEYLCCFRLTWAWARWTLEGDPVRGPWISWN